MGELALRCVVTELQPHQVRVVERITRPDQPGLVVAHGLGSGKTLTSIAVQEALGLPADIIMPASLGDNYEKEVDKHTEDSRARRRVSSVQLLARNNRAPTRPLLIIDEAHRAREHTSKTLGALRRNKARKRLLLTASPWYNHPADIAPLINLAAGWDVLPEGQDEFTREFIIWRPVEPGFWDALRGLKRGELPMMNPQKRDELRAILNKWVDHYPGRRNEHYPAVTHEVVRVPMTRKQQIIYDAVMRNAPGWVRRKVRAGLAPSRREAAKLNAFLAGVRQISNSTAPFAEGTPEEPKLDRAFSLLQEALAANVRAKALVYSNFLDGGVLPYRARLLAAGIPFGEFTGEMRKVDRDELVRRYNRDEIRVLLVSSAGGEGLDLLGTRLVQILEPHWNHEKIRQVEGRAVRFKSHDHLPADERTVHIQRFFAVRTPRGLLQRMGLKRVGFACDEYINAMADGKDRLVDEFRALLADGG